MAFVPDEALRDRHEISLSAFWLYAIVCGRTDRKTGKTYPITWSYIKNNYQGFSRSSFFACRNELQRHSWIKVNGQTFEPLKGKFFKYKDLETSPENRTYESRITDSKVLDSGLESAENRTHESRITDSKVLDSGLESAENRTHESRITDSHIYEYPKSFQSVIQNEEDGETPIATSADLRKDHPAIKGIQEVSNRYPPKDLWDSIIEKLGSDIDGVRLKQCWTEWRSRGYKPTNLAWALEWYMDGIPGKSKSHNSGQGGRRTVGRNDGPGDDCAACHNTRWADPSPEVLAAGYHTIACPDCRPDDYRYVLEVIARQPTST